MRETRDDKPDASGVIWYPTMKLRWRYGFHESPIEARLEQCWRRPDTFEELWRKVEYVEAEAD